MTDTSESRERRHLTRHVLAPSNVDEAEPLIGGAVRKSLRWVRRAQEEGKSLDVMLWMRRIMLDTGGEAEIAVHDLLKRLRVFNQVLFSLDETSARSKTTRCRNC